MQSVTQIQFLKCNNISAGWGSGGGWCIGGTEQGGHCHLPSKKSPINLFCLISIPVSIPGKCCILVARDTSLIRQFIQFIKSGMTCESLGLLRISLFEMPHLLLQYKKAHITLGTM